MTTKTRPILFSAPMIRAILDGRKTQTRRVMNPQPEIINGTFIWKKPKVDFQFSPYVPNLGEFNRFIRHICPYGKIGDRLWVRETFWQWGKYVKNGFTKTGRQRYKFKAIGKDAVFVEPEYKPQKNEVGYHKRPSIFMPRWASRITLEITGIRVERLQDISEEDAKREGSMFSYAGNCENSYKSGFKNLWQSINGAASWNANPWVWVVEFQKIEGEK